MTVHQVTEMFENNNKVFPKLSLVFYPYSNTKGVWTYKSILGWWKGTGQSTSGFKKHRRIIKGKQKLGIKYLCIKFMVTQEL